MATHFPQIHLLCMEDHFIAAFEEAREKHKLPSSIQVQIHNCALNQVPDSVQFDTIVSPANSYGLLDGAFDDAISRAFSPQDDYMALTHGAQDRLYHQYRGFAPPGSCTIVRIPDDFAARSRNVWGTRYLALCPTMRTPALVQWDREVIYECVWSLLCAIDNHNRDSGEEEGEKITSLMMTPLATGVGRVSAEKWASQAVLAMKHFAEASENPDKWSRLNWSNLGKECVEVQLTWGK